MRRTTGRGRSHVLLLVLAALALATTATVAHVLLTSADVEDAIVQQERRANVVATTRARLVRARTGVRRASGALVADPQSAQDVRWLVEFCDTATSADVAALRDVALNARNPLAAGNAVRALGRLHAMAKDRELLKLLDDSRDRVRDETILALGESRDSSTLVLLDPLLRSADAHVRALAARAVGRVGGESGRAVLSRVAADPAETPEVLAFARAGLDLSRR